MRAYQISILAVALGVVVVALPAPAAATTMDEAQTMCRQRGAECVSFGLGEDPGNDFLACVDNRSTGHGVQCVRCQGNNPCTVLREAPGGKRTEVEAILTESMQPADTNALEERVRTLEDRVKALENEKK
ncbi:hypothetical protein EHS39_08995 [Ensifer sp. MPMI2T]|nr:hypothetical protein EHS39_23785 [Ensifer sp. MPMI2T]THK38634.1 hypothetical protein EHS39_08995 [Ensifer sp. MPMI2T]